MYLLSVQIVQSLYSVLLDDRQSSNRDTLLFLLFFSPWRAIDFYTLEDERKSDHRGTALRWYPLSRVS